MRELPPEDAFEFAASWFASAAAGSRQPCSRPHPIRAPPSTTYRTIVVAGEGGGWDLRCGRNVLPRGGSAIASVDRQTARRTLRSVHLVRASPLHGSPRPAGKAVSADGTPFWGFARPVGG